MIYAIAFQIDHDDDYYDRLQSVIVTARREALAVWEEFASFVVIETNKTTTN